MVEFVDVLVDMFILIIAAVIGFGLFYSVSTSGWNTTVVTLWGYIPLVFIGVGIIGLVLKIKYIGH